MAGILIFSLQPGEIVRRPGVQCCFLNFEIPILKFTNQVNAAANIFLYRLVSSGKIVSKAAVYNRGKSVLSSIGIIIAAVEIIVVLDLSQPGKSCFGYKNTDFRRSISLRAFLDINIAIVISHMDLCV